MYHHLICPRSRSQPNVKYHLVFRIWYLTIPWLHNLQMLMICHKSWRSGPFSYNFVILMVCLLPYCDLDTLSDPEIIKSSVFWLYFEISRKIATFIKLSSGHSLIIKLIFIYSSWGKFKKKVSKCLETRA
jgi:hypothetical protein